MWFARARPAGLLRCVGGPRGTRACAGASVIEAAAQDIARDGYGVARLGAAASVRDMQDVAMHLMQVDTGRLGEYNGGGDVQRNTIDGSRFLDSSAGAPSEVAIQFHHEMAYAAAYPRYVTFAMVKQAEEEGTTLLADSVKVQQIMPAPLLGKFRELGVQYLRHMNDESDRGKAGFYVSWQEAFLTDSIDKAMSVGNNPDTFSSMDWVRQGWLRQTVWCPVFHHHPQHGELFFNSILNRHGSWLDGHAHWGLQPYVERPYHCLWGDGVEFSADEVEEIRRVHRESTIAVHLDPGDVLVLDNLRVAHGRTPYRGGRLLGLLLSDMVQRAPCQPPDGYQPSGPPPPA